MGIDTGNILGQLPAARRATSLVRGGIISDPQRNYMFEVRINAKEFNGSFFNDIRFYVRGVTIPEHSIEPIIIKYLGNQIQYFGSDNTNHQVSMNFWDNEHLQVYSYFRSWLNLLREPGTGRAVGKRNVTGVDVHIRLKDHSDLVTTGQFIFKNAYPISLGELPLSYESSDIIDIPVVMTYDEIEVIR
jgi:hypothetical protein